MGTRNLTIVVSQGQYKVAQYCQWDGYPTGQGQVVAEFIQFLNESGYNLGLFRNRVDALREMTDEEYQQANEKSGIAKGSEFISMQQAEKRKELFPHLSRDTGAGILDMIATGEITVVKSSLGFAKDGLFCEWAYVLDLDNEVLEVYQGFQKEPTTPMDRFHFLSKKKMEYYPIKIVKSMPFKEVTTTTMDELEKELNAKEEAV